MDKSKGDGTASLDTTPYMDDCVRILMEERETELDFFLILQAKCYIVIAQMIRPHSEWSADTEGSRPPAAYFIKATQLQLQDIWQNLPVDNELYSDLTSRLAKGYSITWNLDTTEIFGIFNYKHLENKWKSCIVLQKYSQHLLS
jgi:hypothetical protein